MNSPSDLSKAKEALQDGVGKTNAALRVLQKGLTQTAEVAATLPQSADALELQRAAAHLQVALAPFIKKPEASHKLKSPYIKNGRLLGRIIHPFNSDGKILGMFFVQRVTLAVLLVVLLLTPALCVRWVGGWFGQGGRKLLLEIYVVAKLALAYYILFAPDHRLLGQFIAPSWHHFCGQALAWYLLADLFANIYGLILLRNFWSSPFSLNRSLILLILNFFEYNIWFGYLYLRSDGLVEASKDLITPFTAFYFSMVTSSTVGFGDVTPIGAARTLAIIHLTLSLSFLAAVVAYFVSALSNSGEDWTKPGDA
jgi:hypothetical protein